MYQFAEKGFFAARGYRMEDKRRNIKRKKTSIASIAEDFEDDKPVELKDPETFRVKMERVFNFRGKFTKNLQIRGRPEKDDGMWITDCTFSKSVL